MLDATHNAASGMGLGLLSESISGERRRLWMDRAAVTRPPICLLPEGLAINHLEAQIIA